MTFPPFFHLELLEQLPKIYNKTVVTVIAKEIEGVWKTGTSPRKQFPNNKLALSATQDRLLKLRACRSILSHAIVLLFLWRRERAGGWVSINSHRRWPEFRSCDAHSTRFSPQIPSRKSWLFALQNAGNC
jgi:hypothetical protein